MQSKSNMRDVTFLKIKGKEETHLEQGRKLLAFVMDLEGQ